MGSAEAKRHLATWRGRLPAIRLMPMARQAVQGAAMHGGGTYMDIIEQLSSTLVDRVTRAAPFVVAVHAGRRQASGLLWRPDVVVASEQTLGSDPNLIVAQGDRRVGASLAGRDAGTNVAVLKLEAALPGSPPPPAGAAKVGSLALVMGADGSGAPTVRLGVVHAVGGAWHSMAGGRIDALIRLDARLAADEGGPVLSAEGGLLGMSTSGPRGRTIVIPTDTLTRVVDPLLSDGRIARGWLGIGLQPVMIPDGMRQSAGRDSGLMVVSLAASAPAEAAGMMLGDIVLDIDGTPLGRPRALSALLGPDRIGQAVVLRVLRAGAVQAITATVAARPAT